MVCRFIKEPVQGTFKDKRVIVVFYRESTKQDTRYPGQIVRDDMEDPYLTIIKLDNGRYVMGHECIYTVMV